MKNKYLKSFTVYDLVLIAMFSALTIAFKTIVGVLVRLITGPLFIPGGALAGGLYMMWMPIGLCLTNKKGVAFTISLIQVIVLLITSTPGSHGVWSFLTYLLPAIVIEIVFIFQRNNNINVLHFVVATMIANIIGTFGTNLLFFRLPWLPLVFTLTAAALSGAVGGIIGYLTFKKLLKTGMIQKMQNKEQRKNPKEKIE